MTTEEKVLVLDALGRILEKSKMVSSTDEDGRLMYDHVPIISNSKDHSTIVDKIKEVIASIEV